MGGREFYLNPRGGKGILFEAALGPGGVILSPVRIREIYFKPCEGQENFYLKSSRGHCILFEALRGQGSFISSPVGSKE